MMRTFRKVAWLVLCLTPILFWIEFYRASTTQYDENWAHLFAAVFVSFLTVGILIFNRKDFESIPTQKKIVRMIALLFASPLTVGLLVLYQTTIPMQWKWSSSYVNNGKSYSEIKKRNYFKAENYLIFDDLITNSDTTITVVTRNGEIEKIVRLKNGAEIELDRSIFKRLTDQQRENLIKY